jgi:hypothetical protein
LSHACSQHLKVFESKQRNIKMLYELTVNL